MKVIFLLLLSAASSLKLEKYDNDYDDIYVKDEFKARKNELHNSRDNVE